MKILGHRGAPGFPAACENTIFSFAKAINAGADGFELDVRRHIPSGELIVIHNLRIAHTAKTINYFSLDELQRLNMGGGEPIPLLRDVFRTFNNGSTIFNIELKESGMAEDVAGVIRSFRAEGTTVVSAFDNDDNTVGAYSSWADLSKISERVPTALLVSKKKFDTRGIGPIASTARQKYGASSLHIPHARINRWVVEAVHAQNLTIAAWTVTMPWQIRRMRKAGVDTIITEYPAMAAWILKK